MTYRDCFLNGVGLGLAILTGLVMQAQHHLEGALSVKKCYIITMTSQECHTNTNHLQRGCLFKSASRLT